MWNVVEEGKFCLDTLVQFYQPPFKSLYIGCSIRHIHNVPNGVNGLFFSVKVVLVFWCKKCWWNQPKTLRSHMNSSTLFRHLTCGERNPTFQRRQTNLTFPPWCNLSSYLLWLETFFVVCTKTTKKFLSYFATRKIENHQNKFAVCVLIH